MKRLGKRVDGASAKERVLYVEDEDGNLQVAELRLGNHFRLDVAQSSEEACTILKNRPRYYAILMDVQLRGSAYDGLELARVFRRCPSASHADVKPFAHDLPEYLRDIPIVVVTAFGDELDPMRVKDARALAVLPKPIDFDVLLSILSNA